MAVAENIQQEAVQIDNLRANVQPGIEHYRQSFTWDTDKIPGTRCVVSCTLITFIAGCGLAAINSPSCANKNPFGTQPSQKEVDEYVSKHFFEELRAARRKAGEKNPDSFARCLPSLFVLVAQRHHSSLHEALLKGKAGLVTEAPWVANTYHGDRSGSELKAYFVIPKFAEQYITKG